MPPVSRTGGRRRPSCDLASGSVCISQWDIQEVVLNKHHRIEAEASLFKSNRSQAVRIPKALAFPDTVKKVRIIQLDDGLLIKPVVAQLTWAEYFSRIPRLTQEDVDDLLKAVSHDPPPDPVPSFDD